MSATRADCAPGQVASAARNAATASSERLQRAKDLAANQVGKVPHFLVR